MKNTVSHPLYSLLFLILAAACTSQNDNAKSSAHLGTIEHGFTISDAARPHFEEGLLLLHSFEYEDANEAFRKAQTADDQEIMVYWGLAMTHYKALWGLQDVEAGRAVLAEWDSIKKDETQISDLERGFYEGVNILYGQGELIERNQAYVTHMKKLYEAYSSNLEVAAFYSLGLMWADYKDEENLKLSSRIASGIIEENPTHPGALHYMIHANDNPDFAKVAIDAADMYADIAPDATHALHMPSHIYVALGMWNEVVNSNTASYAASIKRMERKGLDGSSRGYHSMAWLHYGLLQQGKYDEAAELLKEKIGYFKEGEGSDSYMINMQNQQRIEAGYWPKDAEFQHVDDSGLGLESKSGMHFVRSLIAFDYQDASIIQKEIDTLLTHLEAAKLLVGEDGIAMCSAGPTRYAPNQSSIQKSQVVISQMKALIAMLENNDAKVERELSEATALELDSRYDPGPPFIAYPSFEMYGDWLLEKGRYDEALEQFNTSLDRRTNRMKALKGKLDALEALGRTEEASEVQRLINKFSDALLAAS
ncbi:tetratricopeptide repeat protein [Ekhidna sp.]|uniref:tetratricopeptide repeat protein n=1 Tax=Ekhidna sp. TaxID=2608089 RepID=UPI003CCC3D54